MDSDLKNMDGDPCDVAQMAAVHVMDAHNKYMAALSEAKHWIRNAAMDEYKGDDLEEQWKASWEARVLVFLQTKAESHSAVLAALKELVDKYEGYGE